MDIKLIASDFDGTIFNYGFVTPDMPGGAVSPRFKEAINRFKANGGIFVLSTGRMFKAALPYARDMGLTGELISYQGAAIFDLATEQPIYTKTIDPCIAAEALEVLEKKSYCHAYHGNDYYVEKKNPYTENYAEYTRIAPIYTGCPLSEYVKTHEMPLYKIYSSIHGPQKDKMLKTMRERFEGRLLVTGSSDTNVEVVSIKASKSKGVAWVAEKYGIKKENIMCFGDALNDLDMIEYAGVGVAVKNAHKALLKTADIIADSCDNDGVAKIIEKYCL